MGLLALFLEWYVHCLMQIAEHLLTIRQWSYSKILISFFSVVFWGRVLYFPLPPHLSASTILLIYFVGCLITYLLGDWLQSLVDGDAKLA